MTTFQTREELEAWAYKKAVAVSWNSKESQLAVLEEIKRVTAAHQHLKEIEG